VIARFRAYWRARSALSTVRAMEAGGCRVDLRARFLMDQAEARVAAGWLRRG
jgi:hypothetical protein